jgi:competence protein ComGC
LCQTTQEKTMRHARQAWSLLELLIVIAGLGVLAALMLVALAKVRESASRTTCLDHLRQLAVATHAHASDHQTMPPYASMTPKSQVFGGWWIHLMPYADQDSLFRQIVGNSNAVTMPGGLTVHVPAIQRAGIRDVQFELLTCPSDPSTAAGAEWLAWTGTSNYLANWYVLGNGQSCYGDPRRFRDITDGLANTVLFAEGYAFCDGRVRPALTVCGSHNFGITPRYLPSDDPSYLPQDYTQFQIQPPVTGNQACDFWRSQSAHAQMPIALAEGSTRFVNPDITPDLWKQLLKPSDGRPGGGAW